MELANDGCNDKFMVMVIRIAVMTTVGVDDCNGGGRDGRTLVVMTAVLMMRMMLTVNAYVDGVLRNVGNFDRHS